MGTRNLSTDNTELPTGATAGCHDTWDVKQTSTGAKVQKLDYGAPLVVVAAGNIAMQPYHKTLLIEKTTPAATQVTLPAVADIGVGHWVAIVDSGGDAGGNTITVVGEDSETIDGAANTTITAAYGGVKLMWTGTEWVTLP